MQCNDPVSNVQWIPIDKIEANDYNPNVVASNELYLLHHSIKNDGYTQPIVTVYDEKRDKYVIVDGFHRYIVGKTHKDISEPRDNKLPVVVIDKSINDRMASTIRHNRARGKHNVTGMANLVFGMLENGWTDSAISRELGMEADELLRLKHVTGFSKLFKDVKYRKAWESKKQVKFRHQYYEGVEK